jgi:hypothetical protein
MWAREGGLGTLSQFHKNFETEDAISKRPSVYGDFEGFSQFHSAVLIFTIQHCPTAPDDIVLAAAVCRRKLLS